MRGTMVVIEGLDIVGKTTISKVLSKKDCWAYYKTPPPPYYKACVKLGPDGHPVFNEERFMLFLECIQYSFSEILKLLDSGISVAVDRWIWTTLSYHFAFNPELELKWKEIKDEYLPYLTYPDLSILLYISDNKVYTERKEGRIILTEHDKVVVNDQLRSDTIWQNFNRLNQDFLLVDNSNSIESTINIISKNLNVVGV